MEIKQNKTNSRFSREIRLTQTKTAADPITAANQSVSCSVYMTVNEPKFGFSDSDIQVLLDTLKGFATTAALDQLLLGES